ncbi:growth/differentiation factor 9 [Kryptolebias marmoratus]|uniref:growth/differentiation factor 9 n=1 Tax=Kryptolebias marmoratus TaxID=37003 RepID=UPI000D530058|nr:growth/differentiation factor 9 [Kryptolebias marmoratus]
MMGKQTLRSAAALLAPLLLLLLPPLASAALPGPGGFTSPYGSILSPLLRALAEHGGARWDSGPRRQAEPERRYMRYLTEVYGGAAGGEAHNTVRLIKPREECLARSRTETFLQDLSYSLDQVRRKEQLLKSALLYSLDLESSPPAAPVCHLSIEERDQSNRCRLCSGIHHALNFTDSGRRRKRRRRGRNWVEVDVTPFLQRLRKHQEKEVRLLVSISCPEEQRAGSNGSRERLEFTLRSPPLVLYLNNTSKVSRRGSPPGVLQTPHGHRHGHKRRWRRESPKSKRGDKSLDMQLPELLPSSEFPTTDCALYDFRVRFSQLKLDHWIVFPPKYNPRYCRGICPRTMGFIYGSPVHTMVQNIIYEKLDSSVPRPSCVPSHYSPLSVMIFEEDGSYVYKEFKDMVATRCTCR